MKTKINVDRVFRNYAEGWVYSDQLSLNQLQELQVNEDDGFAKTIEVDVEYRNTDSGVRVTSVTAYNGGLRVKITPNVNMSLLEDAIMEA